MSNQSEKYITSINTIADAHSDFNFRTCENEEIVAVLSNILEYSDKWAKIYGKSLNGDLTDKNNKFKNTLYHFLKAGKFLQLIIRDTDQKQAGNIYDSVFDFYSAFPKKIELRQASEDFKSNVKHILLQDRDFALNDKNSYTVEMKDAKHSSITNFNDPVWAAKLVQIFDEDYASCKKINLFSLV